MQTINSNDLKGIDVSNWQGTIDFKKVKSSGIQIIYTKVSEGTDYMDPFFKSNYAGAKAQGLKIGFYHFFTPDTQASAIEQANYFVNAISGLNPDCKLALDLETTNGLDKQTISNPPTNNYVYYTVKNGDTLSEIAFKFGVTTDSLAHLNNILNPNIIYPGQVIKI